MPALAQLKLEVMNPKEIGHGNAAFLGDLANGMDLPDIRKNYAAGKYPGADIEFIKANLAFWGKA